jgi:carboxylesterase type B
MLRPWIGMRPSSLRLADSMQHAWLAFAHRGDPRSEALPDWPGFAPGAGEAVVFGAGGGPGHPRRPGVEAEVRALWQSLRATPRPDARAARA